MSVPSGCNPCCSTTTTTQIPGAAGADATVIAPGVVDPEGVVIGSPGQSYLNTATHSLFYKETGTGTTGWFKYIGCIAFLLFTVSALCAPPILRGPTTTNTPADVATYITNAADARIAIDTTKMPASGNLTNLSIGDGSVLASNIPPSALAYPKWTGVITNIGVAATNYVCVTNGIVVTNKYQP